MIPAKPLKRHTDGILSLFLKFSAGSVLAAALSFFTTPVVTALIVPAEFGKASMFNLAYSFCLQIALLGADQSFVRKFYHKDFENNRTSLLMSCILPAVVVGLLISSIILIFWEYVSVLLVQEKAFEFCLLLVVAILIGIFERYAVLIVRMYKKGVYFSVLRLAASIITFLVILFYCNFFNKTMYAIVYSIIVPLLICTLVAIYLERNSWLSKITIHKKNILDILKFGIPFIPTFIVLWVFEGIDKIALRRFSTFNEIGLFAAAFKIVGLLTILQVGFSTFWTPVAYEAFEKQSDDAKQLFKRTFNLLSFVLFLGGILVILFKDVIMIFFAKSYLEAGYIMPFLLLMPIMYTMSEITVGGINFMNKTHLHLFIAILAALTNVICSFLIVPYLGAKGAAISTGVAYIVFFYARTILARRIFFIDFGLPRATLAISLFLIVACINTFSSIGFWNILITLSIISIMAFLYRVEIIWILSVYNLKFKKLKV